MADAETIDISETTPGKMSVVVDTTVLREELETKQRLLTKVSQVLKELDENGIVYTFTTGGITHEELDRILAKHRLTVQLATTKAEAIKSFRKATAKGGE